LNFVLSWNDYIRIHLVSVLTYLTSSLQTSLQNQTKREGYEKDDFVRHEGIDTHPKKVTFLTMAYIRTTFPTMAYIVRHEGIDTHVQKLRRQRMRSFPCAKLYTICHECIDTHVQKLL